MNIISSILILIAIIQSVLALIAMIGLLRGADNILFPGLGLIVTVPAIIVLLLILQILFVGLAVLIRSPKADFNINNVPPDASEQTADIFGDCGNGMLDLSIAEDPNNWGQNPKDRHLDVCIHEGDLKAIYTDTFQVNEAEFEKYEEGKNSSELHERNRKIFEQSISEYPMLGRIYDIYEDYVFTPEEVENLQTECLKAKLIATNPSADLALRKLIYACNEALKNDFHLLFLSD